MSLEPAKPEVWTEQIRIHSYDVDFAHCATLEALCRWFLEAAWNHAEALGLGFTQLASQNKVWVLSRLLLRVERSPRWGETVIIRTWPRPAQRLFAMRDFEVLAPSNERLATGASGWLVLDAHSRRPQRLETLLSCIPRFPERRALEREPEKLLEVTAGETALHRKVHYRDVDVNGHVNSARYIGWLLDSYPLSFHETYFVAELEINYLGETRGEEMISIISQETRMDERHHSVTKEPETEVCRARIRWKRR